MKKIIVIGGGAAGMMAAITAAEHGAQVTLVEKNEKLGKKLFITGKGRCNLTNACDTENFFRKVMTNRRFMYSASYTFPSDAVISFFEDSGMPTKIERGDRVFPVSDKSSDVILALSNRMRQAGVHVALNTSVLQLCTKDKKVTGIKTSGGEMNCDAVILATGGLSYPSTGSTGDGYTFAMLLGHSIVPCFPSLTALKTEETFPKELEGLSLKNVTLAAYVGKKEVYRELGELLFTADGISGPLVLSASSLLSGKVPKEECRIAIDLKPALSREELSSRILRDFDEVKNKQFQNALDKLLPQRLIKVIIALCGIFPEKQVNAITKEERGRLVDTLKCFPMKIRAIGGFSEAVITKGGVKVSEVNPSTMESKLIKDLYFAGEVLDVDAMTGGFNLQIAWSTGYLAGQSAANQ